MRADTEARFPFVTLALAAAALLIHAIPGAASLLEFDRNALATGESWRLITCHATHWSLDHFVWDVLTFIGLGVACERRDRTRFSLTFALAAVAIPLAVYAMLPEMARYRGLSGIDSALFGLVAVDLLLESVALRRRAWVIASAVVIGGFFVKTTLEVTTGSAVFADSAAGAFVPVPLAHLVGACIGAIVALCCGTGFQRVRATHDAQHGLKTRATSNCLHNLPA